MQAQHDRSPLYLLEPYFAEADSLVEGANWADLHTYLPDDLMVKVDLASMAHGLESRSPLLDHVLMEWAAIIPEEIRMARGVTKALFKSAMEPYLPAELIYRPKKASVSRLTGGFAATSKSWPMIRCSRGARRSAACSAESTSASCSMNIPDLPGIITPGSGHC